MKYKLALRTSMIFVILLVTPIVFALGTTYETSTVSRIVGNSPQDLKKQLVTSEFNPAAEGYFTSNWGLGNDRKKIIENQFSNEMVKTSGWGNSDVQNTISGSGSKYLILEAGPDAGYSANPQVTVSNAATWNSYLAGKQNTIVFDSKYSGIAVPNYNSFVTQLAPDSAVVAPMSYPNREFVRSFICNMAKSQQRYTLGEVYRQARNNYRWGVQNFFEMIGLTLLSYSLYGLPTTKVTTPQLSSSYLNSYCSEYDQIYSTSAEGDFTITTTGTSYTRQFSTKLSGYNTEDENSFTVLTVPGTRLNMQPEEPVLPMFLRTAEFPLETVIDEVSLVSFEDPVDITVDKLPSFDGFNFVNRTCYKNEFNESFSFDETFSENSHMIVLRIIPVKIKDCAKGEMTLYKKFSYKVTYIPHSPVLITSVEAPSIEVPNKVTPVKVKIENMQNTAVNGTLTIKRDNEIQSSKDIATTQSEYNMDLITPSVDGRYTYKAEFSQNGTVQTFDEFTIDVRYLSFDLAVPKTLISAGNAVLTTTNHWNDSIQVQVNYKVLDGSTTATTGSSTFTASPGMQTTALSIPALTRKATPYTFIAEVTYLDRSETLTTALSTNAAPVLTITKGALKEGQAVQIAYSITDLDSDTVTTQVSTPFAIDGSFTPNYEQSGDYTMTITTTDGYVTTTHDIGFTIENTNRQPSLSVPEIIEGKEGKEITIPATATDPDNENSVTNDNNTLVITYGTPFDGDGKYTPSYEEAGEITTDVTVSDGELTDTKTVTIKIANANRPPNLDDLYGITVKEGELVNLWLGRDPDNENLVDNDDNTLQYRFYNVPLDHEGKWITNYDNSGAYNVQVDVSDGEFTTSKTITLTVDNVNRAPVITAPGTIEATGSADLSRYIVDPDNTNTATNDDNTLTVTYAAPFDSNGRWAPTQPGTAYTTITVTDGEYTATKDVYVTVTDVNAAPTQTPPEPLPPEPEPAPTAAPQPTTAPVPTTTTQPTPTPAPTAEPAPAAPQPTPEAAPQPAATPVQTIIPTIAASQPSTAPEELTIDVIVGSKKVDYKDTVKVKPDKELKVKIEIENRATNAKGIEIEASIDDLDQEEEDSLKLDPNQREELKYIFEIPRLTDDDEYPLDVFVKDGQQTKEWNVLLKIDKPKHELDIRYLKVEPEIVKCKETGAVLSLKLENTGKEEEEGTLSIESKTLSMAEHTSFDLPQGESQTFRRTISAVTAGEHEIAIKVAYDDKTIEKSAKLTIEACKAQQTTLVQAQPEESSIQVLTSNQKMAVPVSSQSTDVPMKDLVSIAFIVLLSVFSVLLVIVAVPPLFK